MSKIVLLDDALPGQPLWTHLEPVVEYLLANGNRLSYEYRWGSTREGFYCHVVLPIDFDGLEREFLFPPTIILGRAGNVIFDEKTGCLIQAAKDKV